MPKPPKSEKLLLDGPVGQIEALLETTPDQEAVGNVIVCHPHPLYGGTMSNKVAHTLARAFVRRGFNALRFNFRGVGGSAGEHDNGDGEVEDALLAAQWLRDRDSSLPMWIAGFSFGAAVAIKAATRTQVDGLVSVAPAILKFASDLEAEPECPWLVVQGDQDELVSVDDTVAWVDSLAPGPELLVLPDAEHFFHGRLVELREVVEEFIEKTKT